MSKGHKHQHQEQAEHSQEQSQGEQAQAQEIPLDPVHEQVHAYSPPENAVASDPITEAPKVEEPAKEPEPKNE